MVMVKGQDQPGIGGQVHRVAGDLTVLADGRLVLMTGDEQLHDLGDVLGALVGEHPDALGDRHVGRLRLAVEVVDRHERLNNEGMVAFVVSQVPH